jgi:biotin operon repressor
MQDVTAYNDKIIASVAADALAVLKHQPGFHLDAADLCEDPQCSELVLQRAVSRLQQDGHPILVDRDGYWIAERDEVIAYIEKLRRRARVLQELADVLEASVENAE